MRKQCLTIMVLSLAITLCAEDSKDTNWESSSVVVREETIGNIKVTAEARNMDKVSQFRNEWKKQSKKDESEKNTGSEEKDDNAEVKVTFTWSSND